MSKKTFLYDKHVEAGARIVEFAGWEMPVSYTSIIDEHNNVRNNAGLFDVSHMGEFFVSGKDALNFLNTLVPQEVSKLTDGKAVYCQLLNKNAGIIDDLIIYKLKDEDYLIIVNACGAESDYKWFEKNVANFDVKLENQSENYSLLALQGPKAIDIIRKLTSEDLPKFFSIKKTKLDGIDVFLSRTGYTGEDGFEILFKNEFATYFWDKLLEVGKEFSLKPIGLGARDTLRLEAALHLYGNDMDEGKTPIEAGLKWSVSKNKTADYNGKEIIEKQLISGGEYKLIGFEMIDRGIARHEYKVFYNGEEVGHVTSGGVSPVLNKNIGLAYVKTSTDISIDSIIQIEIRDKKYNAKVVKTPFVAKNSNK